MDEKHIPRQTAKRTGTTVYRDLPDGKTQICYNRKGYYVKPQRICRVQKLKVPDPDKEKKKEDKRAARIERKANKEMERDNRIILREIEKEEKKKIRAQKAKKRRADPIRKKDDININWDNFQYVDPYDVGDIFSPPPPKKKKRKRGGELARLAGYNNPGEKERL